MTEREIRGLFTLLELSLNQTIDGILSTIADYENGLVSEPKIKDKSANPENMYHQ